MNEASEDERQKKNSTHTKSCCMNEYENVISWIWLFSFFLWKFIMQILTFSLYENNNNNNNNKTKIHVLEERKKNCNHILYIHLLWMTLIG